MIYISYIYIYVYSACVKHGEKDPRFKADDCVRMTEYKRLHSELVRRSICYQKRSKYCSLGMLRVIIIITNTNETEFKIEKVIKKKDDKLYFKWKGYDNFLIVG